MPTISLIISLDPPNPQLTISMSATKEKATIKVDNYNMKIRIAPDPSALTSTGALTNDIFGSLLTAGITLTDAISGGKLVTGISNKINGMLQEQLSANLAGYTYDFALGSSLSHQFSVNGVNITLEPDELSLDSYNGQLMIYGGIAVK